MKQSIKFSKALIILFFLCNLISPKLFAQIPSNGIFFQAVARDNNLSPANDRTIYIQSSIIQSTPTGTSVLIEEHVTKTDETGVFSISLGNGTRTGGSVANLINIDWSKGPYYLSLKIAITPQAPIQNWDYKTAWLPLGTTLFGAVPYALYAGSTAGADLKVNIADTAKMLANYAKTNQTIDTAYIKSQLATKLSLIVPYTGATAGVNLGGFDLLVNGLSVGRGGGNSAPNTAIGDGALKANTEGFFNTAIGNSALKSNTTGNYNSANGASSLYANTTGSNNTANGVASLAYNTTGSYNTANGGYSLLLNTTGSNNTANGFASLYSNTTGDGNTVNGSMSLYSNTTGSYNTANGYYVLYSNTTGTYNTAIGQGALYVNKTGGKNTAIGFNADVVSEALTNATAIGAEAKVGASNTIQLGNTSISNVKTSGTLTAGVVTYPNAHGTSGQVLTTSGTGTLSWTTVSGGGGGGLTTVGSIGTSNVKGATISGTTITLSPADATNGGIVTTGAQIFAGAKTFNADLLVNGLSVGKGGGNISSNTAIGNLALKANTTGYQNTGIGITALFSNTTGLFNSAIGGQALYANTTGSYNTASGGNALKANTTGDHNTASGFQALVFNTTGQGNTASGWVSLQSNTTGNYNTANGISALYDNTTGNNNTANGTNALSYNTTGNNNTANGYNALNANTTGSNNTAIGYGADVASGALTNATSIGNGAIVSASNTIQLGNTDVSDVKTSGTITAGFVTYPKTNGTDGQVLTANTNGAASWTTVSGGGGGGGVTTVGSIGTSNVKGATISGTTITLSPADATNGGIVTTGAQIFEGAKTFNADLIVNGLSVGMGGGNVSSNTANGNTALKSNTTGNYNAANGASSLYANTEGFQNTANGAYSLYYNTTGYNNTANGATSLYYNTTGRENSANGALALYSNTIGYQNTANGASSLSSNTTGCCNTATGNATLYANMTGSGNTANGYVSMQSNTTGSSNAAYGSYSLLNNITASDNAAFGYSSMYKNTTGSSNAAFGYSSMHDNTTGSNNSAFGYNSLGANKTGSRNIAYGKNSLAGNIAGDNNTANGYQAGMNLTSGSNNIFLGYNAQPSSETISNEITLGDQYITSFRVYAALTNLSDRRDKTNIIPIVEGLEFLKKLNPVSFTWNTRDKAKVGIKSAGFIAQDLLALQKQSIIGDNLDLVSENNPEKLEARYGNLLPVIVKAIQEESAEKDKMFEDQQKEIKALKERLNALEKLLNELLNKKQ